MIHTLLFPRSQHQERNGNIYAFVAVRLSYFTIPSFSDSWIAVDDYPVLPCFLPHCSLAWFENGSRRPAPKSHSHTNSSTNRTVLRDFRPNKLCPYAAEFSFHACFQWLKFQFHPFDSCERITFGGCQRASLSGACKIDRTSSIDAELLLKR